MLNRLFSKSRTSRGRSGPPGGRAYAIGDVHGRLDLLVDLLARIEADNARRGPAKTWLVFLGDLVDRGPDSRGVVDLLVNRPPAFARNVFLKGNHEEFFVDVLGGDDGGVQNWLAYGGTECAQSYGLTSGWMLNATPAAIMERLIRQVPASHARFLDEMHDSFRFGDYLFVHAGIRPGVALDKQVSRDLRWIREGFLDDRSDHGSRRRPRPYDRRAPRGASQPDRRRHRRLPFRNPDRDRPRGRGALVHRGPRARRRRRGLRL